jgi:4-amino-4-deoxy-L-arabinose transferase-like glycosyltransferase
VIHRPQFLPTVQKLFCSPLVIIVAAVVARVGYLIHFIHGQPATGNHYFPLYEVVSVAKSVAEGHGFSSPLYIPSGPTAMVTPIYTYILAGVFRLFGTLSPESSIAIRLLDVVFSALTCVPIIAIGRRVFSAGTAALAGWIWAALPSSIFYAVVWIWDTSLSTLVLTLALWTTYLVAERDDAKAWRGLGFAWGIGTLVNSAMLPVFPGCLVFAVYRARQRGVSWFRPAAATVLVFFVTLSPWIVRNERVFRGKVFLRSNFGLELWLGNNPEVPISCSCWLHPTSDAKERARYLQLGEVDYVQEKQRQALQFIETHPSDTLRHIYHRFMETWTGFSDSFADIWASRLLFLRATLVLNYSLTILAFTGLLLAYRTLRANALLLLNLMAVFPVVYYLCHMDPRYRQPIEPVIAMLAAFAVVRGLHVLRSRLIFSQQIATEGVKSQS